ncbi:hypothetical protein DYB30_003765 [Aphanomyces astaci]|uniref:Uncharacterized protein n=1 Tax=Aphanomyces astaci TaxID=112090 RepID=A0A397CVF9_APHAT|nr:hypothetical protein DYB30_003765 [Aphanomyces astaci]
MPPRKLVTTATAAQLDEVGDLFDELVDKDSGCVTAKEMAAILPYTAGAATADVQAMIDDMVARKASLGKKQFVRLVSKRMYGGAWNAYMEALENAPLAHVIVSMKRRKHLVHFANFYLAKGVAGAELVVPADTDIHQNVTYMPLYSTAQLEPSRDIASFSLVVDVVAGDDHTMALSDMGDVYTFGNNWCGQLGQGKRDTLWSPVPAPVEFPEAVLVDASHIVTSMALSAGCVVLGISTTGTYDQFYADNNTHSPSTNSDETNDAHDNNNGGVAPM